MLAKPENKVVADQSKLLNELFARKAFSWTSVFMQLEEIMPAQLHVMQLSPELNKQNQLVLRLLVAGGSREHALVLLRRLEQSPYFTNAKLNLETMVQGAAPGDSVQFDISALYIPHPELAGERNKKDEAKTETNEKLPVHPLPLKNLAKTPVGKAGH
jgi:Tfp pilus assembly protein PilN